MVGERHQRLEQARRLMRAQSLDALFVSWGTSLLYYSGIRWQGGERLFALVLPAKGEPFFVAPAFLAMVILLLARFLTGRTELDLAKAMLLSALPA